MMMKIQGFKIQDFIAPTKMMMKSNERRVTGSQPSAHFLRLFFLRLGILIGGQPEVPIRKETRGGRQIRPHDSQISLTSTARPIKISADCSSVCRDRIKKSSIGLTLVTSEIVSGCPKMDVEVTAGGEILKWRELRLESE